MFIQFGGGASGAEFKLHLKAMNVEEDGKRAVVFTSQKEYSVNCTNQKKEYVRRK